MKTLQQLRDLFLNKPIPPGVLEPVKAIPVRVARVSRASNPIPDLEKIPGWWKGRYEINHVESLRAMNSGDRERARIFADRARLAEVAMENIYSVRKRKKEGNA